MDLMALTQACAPAVHPQTMAAIVRVESGANPYAIGVVGGRLARQPRNLPEAVATANALAAGGWNFSLGVAQVNRHQLARHGLDYVTAFDPCRNLAAGARILQECYSRAGQRLGLGQQALAAALSCYYSGNFTRGFRSDGPGQGNYVQRVYAHARKEAAP